MVSIGREKEANSSVILMKDESPIKKECEWPDKRHDFPPVMTPAEAAQFLRLDRVGHTPESAKRTLDYWRSRGELRATKYGRHVWYLKEELEAFLKSKTES